MARVLLVEDEPNIAGIIVFKLEREGHTVRSEPGARSGRAAAAEFRPDLVLLDSSLDDGDALELLAELSRERPVIVMTEFRDEETPRRALAAGAARTIGKPFKPTVLARVVAEVAGQP